MISIRHTLGRQLVVVLFLVLALIGGGLYLLVRRLLSDHFDVALGEKARVLAGLMKQENGGFELELAEAPMPEFERAIEPEYFQLWLGERVFQRSGSLGQRDLPAPTADALSFADLTLPDGRPGRVAWLRFPVRIDPDSHPDSIPAVPAWAGLVVARGRGPLDQALSSVQKALALAGLLLLVGVPLVVAGVVRRGLNPLDRLAEQASRIHAGSLDRRFTIAGLPAELHPIASRLDDLLERLAAAFERERRFSADVAHELRTPIAELRALAEVALQLPESPEAARQFQDVLGAALQMEALVATLLTLARCEAGRQPVAREPVDLSRALGEAWAPLAEKARGKALRVGSSAPETFVHTDRLMLGSILGNLLANAVEYAPAGGELSWEVARRAGGVEVIIANSNGGLERADLAHVFEPFWRKDAARSDGRHGGLGLSLVSAFARLIGAEVRLEIAGDRVRATFSLPSSGPAAPTAA
jgi:two-component system sensor histidine kinase QseC